MRAATLIRRSLAHHWRTHLAVLLGAAVSCAALTGALLVGDSVRGSLRELTLDRLGSVDFALVAGRFFRQELAAEIEGQESNRLEAEACPAIFLQGAVYQAEGSGRASQVQVLGVNKLFWKLGKGHGPESLEGREVILNETLAAELGVAAGQEVLIRVEKPSPVPRDSALGGREETIAALRLPIKTVLPSLGLGRFGLNQTQHFPRNVYVPLDVLQRAIGQEKMANAILVATGEATSRARIAGILPQKLREKITVEDLGLRFRACGSGVTCLESDRLILEPVGEALAHQLAGNLHCQTLPVFTYLANEIAKAAKESSGGIPYSLISALDISPGSPFGRLITPDGSDAPPLADNEILLNEWAAVDLQVQAGDDIRISYYSVGDRNELVTREALFVLRGILKLEGLGGDRTLTPRYPGIEGARNMRDWQPPFPIDLGRIRLKDETYWKDHGSTPKAFVSLAAGQKLWASRFGRLTSLRLAPSRESAGLSVMELEKRLLALTDLPSFGLIFDPVKERGLAASEGATDFSGLFFGFSLFLIASAAILTGLLFQLGVERRAGEIGALLALGFPARQVRALFLAEAALLAGLGGLLGLAGAFGYAWLLLAGLGTWWIEAIGSPILKVYVRPSTFGLGFCISFAVAGAFLVLALRRLGRPSVRSLLANDWPQAAGPGPYARPSRGRWARLVGIFSLAAAAGSMAAAATGHLSEAAGFFCAGGLLLISGFAFLSCRLGCDDASVSFGRGISGILRLAVRNGKRHPTRSMLTAGLVGCASFILVAVAANRHDPRGAEPDFHSGDGGFALIAESTLPLYHDIGSGEGREAVGLPKDSSPLENTRIFQLRLRPGDDASCLNLYQPQKPRILGIPPDLIGRGGFKFQASLAKPGAPSNPWDLLESPLPDGAIPIFGDANTVLWMLHLGLGKDLLMQSEDGRQVKLRLAGLLQGSIFQSELLMAESHFLRLFPAQGGYRVFLVEAPPDRVQEVARTLEGGLTEYGFDAVHTSDRLASYRAVENTYLSAFQILGGLGLLLGTLGLGAVLLRNVWERRAELAMLRAMGFTPTAVAGLVAAENMFLLAMGLASGVISALVAVAPHLWRGGGGPPWASLMLTFGLVLAAGMAASAAALITTLRSPLLPALRGD